MPVSSSILEKIDVWEKLYFSLDEPVPFKDDLFVYPVMLKDFYKFYSFYGCLLMDKTTKKVKNEQGEIITMPNPKGISQSYLAYLIEQMESPETNGMVSQQVIGLFELIFHIKNGLFCPECGEEIKYEDVAKELSKIKGSSKEETAQLRNEKFFELLKCPKCGTQRRDIISIKNAQPFKTLMVYNTEINQKDFDELKALVPRQNILDYDGDKYIDPTLKEELEVKARLQNKDYTSPSLEKQMVCVCAGTGYTLKELKEEVSMRKLSLLLKVIDAKGQYYAQIQGAYSGMVKFKEDPKHWIFGNDSKDIKKEITNYDNFKQKLKPATG